MRRRVIIILGALVGIIALLAGLRALARSRSYQLFGELVSRVPTAEKRVALTFDDGPSPALLDSMLEVLGARGVHATFFVIGADLAAAPDAGRRLVAAGHELANHSYSHRRMVLVSPTTVRTEIERTDSLIRAAGHEGAIHFRPPYGYKLFALPWYLSRTGRTTVTWDVEPDSYSDVSATAEGIVEHTLARVRPGSIILLHVWYPGRRTSLAAVGPLIDSLHARGYEIVPFRELVSPRRKSASKPVFEIDLSPGEGIPVIHAMSTKLVLRERPDTSSRVAGTLSVAIGHELPYDSTRFQTTGAGMVRVVAPARFKGRDHGSVTRLSVDQYYAPFASVDIDVAPPATIEFLQYRAEGSCFVRVDGRVIDAEECPVMDDKFRLESEPKTLWWIYVRGAESSGWLLLTDSSARVVKRTF